MPTTEFLIDRLQADISLRRICGWENRNEVPHVSAFSRAFFKFADSLIPLSKSRRGKQKQRNEKNILDRLRGKRDCVLRFMYDFSVPFTNNQAEQDVRMAKLKEKISGGFRNQQSGAKIFCRVRSYPSTARKQDWNIWESLMDTIRGSPRLLQVHQQNFEVFSTSAHLQQA